MNTGAAPCIRRSTLTGKYVVGTEMSTYTALSDRHILTNQRSFEVNGGRTVFVYKTRKPAVTKFQALCVEQDRVNEEMWQEHHRELQAAQGGDMGAALRAGDF